MAASNHGVLALFPPQPVLVPARLVAAAVKFFIPTNQSDRAGASRAGETVPVMNNDTTQARGASRAVFGWAEWAQPARPGPRAAIRHETARFGFLTGVNPAFHRRDPPIPAFAWWPLHWVRLKMPAWPPLAPGRMRGPVDCIIQCRAGWPETDQHLQMLHRARPVRRRLQRCHAWAWWPHSGPPRPAPGFRPIAADPAVRSVVGNEQWSITFLHQPRG